MDFCKLLYVYDKVYNILDVFYDVVDNKEIFKLIKPKLYEIFGDFGIEDYELNILED